MPITPFFRSPFTDLTGSLINHQTYDKCGEMEMNMMDCLEAYGAERGKRMCAELVQDFNECYTMRKQSKRFHAMLIERDRQYYAGERTAEEMYAPPPRVDAY